MAESKLIKASRMALIDYMALDKEETLLVVTDENKRDIGMALYNAGNDICSEAFYLEMKSRHEHGEEPPVQIADMMRQVDVVICPTSKSLTHTKARRDAARLGVRVGTMPGITVETLCRVLSADYEKVIEQTELVAAALKGAELIHVATKHGTDVTFDVSNRKIIKSTGVLRNIGESGNLPSGEVYVAPNEGTTNGVIAIDGSIGGIGLLSYPVKVSLKDGYSSRITGKEIGKKFSNMLKEYGENARAIGEFGIGTNYKAQVTGDVLEDEKALGTVHFAFGNNLSMGGSIDVPLHIDCVILEPDVIVDERLIMKKGIMLV